MTGPDKWAAVVRAEVETDDSGEIERLRETLTKSATSEAAESSCRLAADGVAQRVARCERLRQDLPLIKAWVRTSSSDELRVAGLEDLHVQIIVELSAQDVDRRAAAQREKLESLRKLCSALRNESLRAPNAWPAFVQASSNSFDGSATFADTANALAQLALSLRWLAFVDLSQFPSVPLVRARRKGSRKRDVVHGKAREAPDARHVFRNKGKQFYVKFGDVDTFVDNMLGTRCVRKLLYYRGCRIASSQLKDGIAIPEGGADAWHRARDAGLEPFVEPAKEKPVKANEERLYRELVSAQEDMDSDDPIIAAEATQRHTTLLAQLCSLTKRRRRTESRSAKSAYDSVRSAIERFRAQLAAQPSIQDYFREHVRYEYGHWIYDGDEEWAD